MAAPVASTRITPTAWKVDQGYRILITLAANKSIAFFEVEVTPAGVDGGDAIKTSTQFNNTYHSKRPRHLMMTDGAKVKAQLAAGTRHQCELIINVETTITETYPDGSTYAYYGFLKSVKFGSFKEGEKPDCDIEIVETDWDYVNAVEAGPVYVPTAGTSG